MNLKELEKIKDSIEFKMIIEQNIGYKNEYSPLLQEEISLYNEVIRIQEIIKNAKRIYLKSLQEHNEINKKMPNVAVDMFNALEEFNEQTT